MAILAKDLPNGVTWNVPYDTTPFITASIKDVVRTLVEAIILVFFVMLIFLQNIRATIIPTLVIPVALLGTFIGLNALHFSLNQLTLFGMVLAIGIVVDDAIVVIENVERIMSEEKLSPKKATRKAMGQITGAIIAITVVLAAVFVPSALQPGATGIIYAQFAMTIAISMGFSAFLAMSFTPSLCATILVPEHHADSHFVFRWFNRGFNRISNTYFGQVGRAVRHAPRWMMRVRARGGAGRVPVHAHADHVRSRRGPGLHAGDRQPAFRLDAAAQRRGHGRDRATSCCTVRSARTSPASST